MEDAEEEEMKDSTEKRYKMRSRMKQRNTR
jgi:hypothetical protein